ncbi:hypothetical protein AO073_15225 [Pseudomonas syringae ICMP 11293]|nr:hypothetical protein AO073_15225 [Pseudomonas syringae ICMP 11293]
MSLRDLAGELGLRPGSLYGHIESKQSLLFELVEDALVDLLHATRQRLRTARDNREGLYRFIQTFVDFNLANQHSLQLILRESVNLTDEQRSEIALIRTTYANLLRATVPQGGLITSQNIDLLVEAITGLLFAHTFWKHIEMSKKQMTDNLANLALGMITAVGPNKTAQIFR